MADQDPVKPENTKKDAEKSQSQNQKKVDAAEQAGVTPEEYKAHEEARTEQLDPENLDDINRPPGTSIVG